MDDLERAWLPSGKYWRRYRLLAFSSLPLTNTLWWKTEAWHFIIMVCLSQESFVCSVSWAWRTLSPSEVKVISQRTALNHCGFVYKFWMLTWLFRILNDQKLLVVWGNEREPTFRMGTCIISSSFLERRGNRATVLVMELQRVLSTSRTQQVLLIKWWNWFYKRIVFCSIQQSGHQPYASHFVSVKDYVLHV